MSQTLAISPTSPVAPAAAEAPAATTAPAANGAPPVEKKATLQDKLDALLKEEGGLTYKARGKEHKATDAASIIRNLSRAHGMEETVGELSKDREAIAQERERKAAIKAERDPSKRWKMIEEFLGDGGSLSEAAEARFLSQAEEHERQQQMTPREREMAAKLAELEKFREGAAEKEQRENEERADREYQDQSQRIFNHIAGKLAPALVKAGVPKTEAHEVMPRAFKLMDELRAHQDDPELAGLNDDDIAEALVGEREDKVWNIVTKRDPTAFVAEITKRDPERANAMCKAFAVWKRSTQGTANQALESRPPSAKPVQNDDFAPPPPAVKRSW